MSSDGNQSPGRATTRESAKIYEGFRNAYVVLPIGDKRLMAKVLDISAEGFKAVFAPASEKLPEKSGRLKNVILGSATHHQTLRLITVWDIPVENFLTDPTMGGEKKENLIPALKDISKMDNSPQRTLPRIEN